jgi:hypothetical protein
MILDADALLRLVAHHAATLGVPVPTTRAKMQAIVAEAERIAGGRSEDEPAALFYVGQTPNRAPPKRPRS